ncbi:MAG: 3-isopropylmalate dehydratase small subunit [Eubacteriales bacterium]|jgi:3-isopropylmalate/(R)-2-methylmalate dehydratase small subunit|nr:3-isopropylmalate dehydratase small subunit [Eubacteriales bacterium]
MNIHGKAFKYGANVDTDVIIPARYLNTSDPDTLAGHCMEDLDPDFIRTVTKGDLIVAGPNFGCGSSREHAPVAIKASGISCVIAPSFARIFFRNAINMGLPILESAEAAQSISTGDQISVDLSTGRIVNETTGETFQAQPFPPFIQKIIEANGLMGTLKQD